jgi:hypothetical protein
MSEKYDGFGSGNVNLDLQPLVFDPFKTKDGKLAYRAKVKQLQAPGSPVFALTLSAELPDLGQSQAVGQFSALRDGLRAGFLLTAPRSGDHEPPPDDDNDVGPDPDEPGAWEVTMITDVLRTTVVGEYGVVFEVQAPIPGPYDVDSDEEPGRRALRKIRSRIRHVWTAKPGTTSTTVRARTNYIVVDPGGHQLSPGDSQPEGARTVKISNYTNQLARYTMTGEWNGPQRVTL